MDCAFVLQGQLSAMILARLRLLVLREWLLSTMAVRISLALLVLCGMGIAACNTLLVALWGRIGTDKSVLASQCNAPLARFGTALTA